MSETDTVFSILALIAIYAIVFFLIPNRLAQYWERDDLPVHEIMHHFGYWQRRRVLIAGVGFTTCAVLAWSLAASIIPAVAVFVGLASLAAADWSQIRRLSRDLPSWSPLTDDENASGMNRGSVLDLLFGKKPAPERRGK